MNYPNTHQNLTDTLTQIHQDMSVEQMRLYQVMVTKSLEMREAEEAFEQAMGQNEGGDAQTSAALEKIHQVLSNPHFSLSGNDCVLLACLDKKLGGEEFTDTRRINIQLHRYGRKPSNTTKVVDSLEKKGSLEIRSDGLHSHKMYCLTPRGEQSVYSLIEKLTKTNNVNQPWTGRVDAS